MKNLTDTPPRPARRPWIASWASTGTMVAFTAIAAVISYNDGLYLIRFAGATGREAYLYPLLPDGLILISSIRLYRAAPKRPGWAMAGVILGICLTLSMNVGAGVLHNWLYALADAVVPVVFFVALEILRGSVRRGRGASDAPPVPAVTDQPGPIVLDGPEGGSGEAPETGSSDPGSNPAEPLSPDDALLVLINSGSRQEIADLIGVSKSKVNRLYWRLTRTPKDEPEGAAPESAEPYWESAFEAAAGPEPVAEPSLNGSGS